MQPHQRNKGGRPVATLSPPEPSTGAVKGRGTAWRIEHRFQACSSEGFDDGWGALDQQASEEHVPPATQVIEEQAKTILTRNDSPDIGFDRAVNPYRGCEHGCIYCFARPTHSYLNLSPGLDFETRIVAKVNSAQRLEEALSRKGYVPQYLNIGSATDAYQPVERRLRITRALLEVLHRFHHPWSLVTKSSGVERDLDLIAPMARQRLAAVYVSLTSLDSGLSRILEPRAAAPQRRLQTVRTLAEAGVPVGVSLSPMIPFLNEPELERLVQAAAEAGAQSAFMVVLRLPWEVNPLFQQWLQQHFPERADRVMARVREMHGGQDYRAEFKLRQRGSGVWADLLRQRFEKACARAGLNRERIALDASQFRVPAAASGGDGFGRPDPPQDELQGEPQGDPQGRLF